MREFGGERMCTQANEASAGRSGAREAAVKKHP